MSLLEILQGANVALNVLQARLVLVITLVLTFTLFAWAMWMQTQLGTIIAAAWAVLVFLPVLWQGGRHGEVHQSAQDTGSGSATRSTKIAA